MSAEATTLARLLRIGALPRQHELKTLYREGFRRLINVSGADIRAFYPGPLLHGFDCYQTGFRDIFSAYTATQAGPAHYLELSEVDERSAFLGAVYHLLKHWRGGHSVYVCCHRGIGRSPTVSLAALGLYLHLPSSQLAPLIEQLRPQARLTSLSHAAAAWAGQIPPPPRLALPEKQYHALIQRFSRRLDHVTASA